MAIIQLAAYDTIAPITMAVASLASDTNLLAGRASTAVSNITNRYLDALVSGKVRVGTSPTGGVIELWAYAAWDGTPAYVDGITGTDANDTLTSANVKASGMRYLWATSVDTTSARDYFIPPTSIAQTFGQVPPQWGLFLVHSTGVALDSTAGNHYFAFRGIKYDSV